MYFELDGGALLAFFGFESLLLELAGCDDAGAFGERSCYVLGEFTPDGAAEEECVTVLVGVGCLLVLRNNELGTTSRDSAAATTVDTYVVPRDPIDDLGCESCQ